MIRLLALGLVVLMVLAAPASAGKRGEIDIEVPPPVAAQASGTGTVCIIAVVDNRSFEDRPAEANIPSVAEGGVASLTADSQRFFIGRVRDGYGKARNNIFSTSEWPVETIVRRAVSDQLSAQGYTIVSDPAAATISMEVSIEQLWGYILVQGGGWAGNAPKMAGEIRTILTTHGPGEQSERYELSGTATHKFGLMTGKHWTLMFGELLTDYMKELAKLSF